MIAFPLGLPHNECVMHLTFGVSLFGSTQGYGHGCDVQLVKVSLRDLISMHISLVFSWKVWHNPHPDFSFFLAGVEKDGGQRGYDTIGSKHCIS